MALNVMFKKLSLATFTGLTPKDPGTFYRVQLEGGKEDFYLGSQRLNNQEDITTAINKLDTEADIVLATETAGVVTLTKAVKEVDGIIKAVEGTAITLAKVATTGASDDVAIPTTSKVYNSTNVTNVSQAIDKLADMVDAGGTGSKVYLTSTAGGNNTGILKTYSLYQGVDPNGSAAEADKTAAKIGEINIPKDFLVKSGKVVSVTEKAGEAGKFVDSDGTDCDATVTKKGQYLKFVINTADGTAEGKTEADTIIWIGADALVTDLDNTATIAAKVDNVITIKTTVEQVDGAVSAGSGSITFAKVAATGAAGDVAIGATTKVYEAGKVENVDQAINALATYTDEAIKKLDTAADVTVASVTDNVVTIKGSIAEEDGIVKAGTAANIVLEEVAMTGASADVSYVNSTAGMTKHLSANTVQGALDAVVGFDADTKDSASVVGAKKYADNAVATALEWVEA